MNIWRKVTKNLHKYMKEEKKKGNKMTDKKIEKENKVKIKERGWAGHFILGGRCRFHRNTLITKGRKKIIVSTVGILNSNDNWHDIEEIGYNRYYETRAFKAKKDGAYIEVDVTKEVPFESNWCLDYYGDSSDNDADDMHDAVVSEVLDKYFKETK